jgi:hypothetical protein
MGYERDGERVKGNFGKFLNPVLQKHIVHPLRLVYNSPESLSKPF